MSIAIVTETKPALGAVPGSAEQRLRIAGQSLNAEQIDDVAEVLRGCIIAQAGPFKSEGRGEFDLKSLQTIIALAEKNSLGIRCNYCHRDESHDGLGRHLGRFKSFRLDTVGERESDGEMVTEPTACIRADLFINATSHDAPEGDLGGYVLKLAKTDPQAISSSMVIATDTEYRLNPDGTRKTDANGDYLPPLWRPTKLMSADIVAVGDAVDGLLSAGLSIDSLPDAVLHRGVELLDKQFAGKDSFFVQDRCTRFLHRYLQRRYGGPELRPVFVLSSSSGDDNPGAPDAPEHPGPDDNPNGPDGNPVALHDGCRSTLAYHHLTACRLCGGTMLACGCQNVEHESRVITMSKQPCAACLAKADGDGKDKEPDGDEPPPAADSGAGPDVELAKAKLFLTAL